MPYVGLGVGAKPTWVSGQPTCGVWTPPIRSAPRSS